MNKESFIQVLRNPKSISADQLAQVEEVVEQFPYFQIARSVIACGSKSLSKEDAQSKLANAAIYTTNRQLLKKYVNGQFDFDVADSIQVGIHRETIKRAISTEGNSTSTGTKKRAKFRIIERRSHDDEKSVSSGKFVDLTKKREEDDIDEELTVIDAHGVEKTTVTHTSIQTAKEQADKETSEEIEQKPQAEISTAAIDQASAEQEEVKEKPVLIRKEKVIASEAVIEETVEPKLKAGELVDDVHKNLERYRQSRDHYLEVEQRILSKQESDAINDAIEKANTKIEKVDDKPAETSKVKATTAKDKPKADTLKTEAKKESPKKTPPQEAPKAKSIVAKTSTPKEEPPIEMVPEKVDNNIIDNAAQEPSNSSTDSADKKEVQKEIIERFIKSNPKILPADEEPKGEIADLSIASAEMKDDFATENLAVILVRQGKREKAIEIYEKLILKIPKKKSYFAARIAELK
ncbi:MAG: hypothetical protein RIF33_25435 [Cyclobacteriaceae bacterium]